MSFFETPRFPDSISFGARGGPGYSTNVLEFPSGGEQRNQNWIHAKMRWDVAYGLRNQGDMNTLIAFFRSCKGRAHGFRFKDWVDYQVATSEGRLGLSDGSSASGAGNGTPTYLLYKRYSSGQTEDRIIRKPVTGTIAVQRNAVAVTFGAAAGNISLDYTTGIVTFVADAFSNASSITPGATTQVVLASNLGLVAGKLLWLDNFAGADAALVNNKAHTINSIAGGGPYTFTLATDTSGKTITIGAGVGRKYPQASDALTWSGQFDVPCRFDTDQMQIGLEAYNRFDWDQIPVMEIRT